MEEKKRLEEEAQRLAEEERKRIEEEEKRIAEEEARKEAEKQRRKEKEKARPRVKSCISVLMLESRQNVNWPRKRVGCSRRNRKRSELRQRSGSRRYLLLVYRSRGYNDKGEVPRRGKSHTVIANARLPRQYQLVLGLCHPRLFLRTLSLLHLHHRHQLKVS